MESIVTVHIRVTSNLYVVFFRISFIIPSIDSCNVNWVYSRFRLIPNKLYHPGHF